VCIGVPLNAALRIDEWPSQTGSGLSALGLINFSYMPHKFIEDKTVQPGSKRVRYGYAYKVDTGTHTAGGCPTFSSRGSSDSLPNRCLPLLHLFYECGSLADLSLRRPYMIK
jgi:hypothetical protein